MEIKIKTVRQMAEEDLLKIFKNHIGENKKISRRELFYKVYNLQMNHLNKLKADYMWNVILKACGYCRKKTNCMIMSDYYKFDNDKPNSGAYYFVAKNLSEANKHANRLNKISKGINKAGKSFLYKVKMGYSGNPSKWQI